MPANPRVGQTGLQELWKGHAEDHFRVVARLGKNALVTEEWTPLEPGVLDHKTYVRGVGTILERTVRGGDELNELVSLTRSSAASASSRPKVSPAAWPTSVVL